MSSKGVVVYIVRLSGKQVRSGYAWLASGDEGELVQGSKVKGGIDRYIPFM